MKTPKTLRELQEVLMEKLNPTLLDNTRTWKHRKQLDHLLTSYSAEIRDIPKKDQKSLLLHAQEFLSPLADNERCRSMTVKWRNIDYCPKGPHGDYLWSHQCALVQEVLWLFPEFVQGYRFGAHPIPPYRDANPYPDYGRHRSWDYGYILGVYEKQIHQWIAAKRGQGDGAKTQNP